MLLVTFAPEMQVPSIILIELQYLPSVQYFSKLVTYPSLLLEQHEHFTKGNYRNRAHIASSQGLLRLSIPLQKGKNSQQSIREVKISHTENWAKEHWQTIQSAYGRAPFFEFYADALQAIFEQPGENLWDFNWRLLKTICQLMHIDFEPKLTTEYQKGMGDEVLDFRSAIHPKPHRALEDKHFSPAKYAQVFEDIHGFIPNLSILDLLFCCGPESGSVLERSFVHK